jgi:hypothetical protein
MTLDSLIKECVDLNILLLVDDLGLLCRSRKGVITPELSQQLTQHKPQIVALLTETSTAALPWECGCVWESACLPPPTHCVRCEQFSICLDCGKCRGCWLARVVGRQVKVPIER